MTITYAITVCNEFAEIQRLISFLQRKKRLEDNIVVLYDALHGDELIEDFLRANSINKELSWIKSNFNGDFSEWKNFLNDCCYGDYIFQIDADEIPSEHLIDSLPEILKGNDSIDVYLVPRINTVEGLTQSHLVKWGWNLNEEGFVNWPDYQMRIYKNSPEIRWKNKVHEVISGHKSFANLPMEKEFALQHPKTIARQEKQNAYYENL
jgi:hypothetical protein